MNQNMSATKTGYLLLTSDPHQNRHVRLMAVAYTRVSDPFIVFYRDSAWIWKKPVAFLRLKSCAVTENKDDSFTLTPQGERIGSSTGLLCFTAETPEERQEWLKVLTDCDREDEKPVMKMKRRPRNVRQMPVIQESCSEELNVTEQRRSSLIPVWNIHFDEQDEIDIVYNWKRWRWKSVGEQHPRGRKSSIYQFNLFYLQRRKELWKTKRRETS